MVSKDNDHHEVMTILLKLDSEVEEKCQCILQETQKHIETLRHDFKVEMQKLPFDLLSMSMETFYEHYGDDKNGEKTSFSFFGESKKNSSSSFLGESQKYVEESPSKSESPLKSSSSTRKRRLSESSTNVPIEMQTPTQPVRQTTRGQNVSSSQLKTPQFNPRLPQTPATQARRPRRGESIFSAQGSPLGELSNSVVAHLDEANSTPKIMLGNLAAEDFIALAAKNIQLKKNAVGDLRNLQESVALLLKQLEPSPQ